MNEMLLDRAGDAPISEGYQIVDSEVGFLRLAIENVSLLVRGDRLCQWAETFCNGRRIPYRELLSPTQSLRELVPSLSESEAKAIRASLPDQLANKLHHLNLTELLQALFPNALWDERPSKEHAANWLLWLYIQAPDSVFEPLLAENGRRWQRKVDDATYTIYAATNATNAGQLLDSWLGLTHDPVLVELGVFPRKLPDSLRAQAIRLLKDQVITKRGALLNELETQPIQPELLRLAAQETVNYLVYNPRYLTTKLRDQLIPYLALDDQNRILKLMPPAMPETLPEQPEAVLSWFRDQYMPARHWQAMYGTDMDSSAIRECLKNNSIA